MGAGAWAAAGAMFASSLASYQDRRQAAAVTRRMQEFNNILGRLNNAMNSNALAAQATSADKQALQDRMNISAAQTKYKASLDLQVAAAEIGGTTVTLQENDILRKADSALVANKAAEDAARMNILSQKENLDFNTIAGKDYTIVQEPNAFFALLGATTQGYMAYSAVDNSKRYATSNTTGNTNTRTQTRSSTATGTSEEE